MTTVELAGSLFGSVQCGENERRANNRDKSSIALLSLSGLHFCFVLFCYHDASKNKYFSILPFFDQQKNPFTVCCLGLSEANFNTHINIKEYKKGGVWGKEERGKEEGRREREKEKKKNENAFVVYD